MDRLFIFFSVDISIFSNRPTLFWPFYCRTVSKVHQNDLFRAPSDNFLPVLMSDGNHGLPTHNGKPRCKDATLLSTGRMDFMDNTGLQVGSANILTFLILRIIMTTLGSISILLFICRDGYSSIIDHCLTFSNSSETTNTRIHIGTDSRNTGVE